MPQTSLSLSKSEVLTIHNRLSQYGASLVTAVHLKNQADRDEFADKYADLFPTKTEDFPQLVQDRVKNLKFFLRGVNKDLPRNVIVANILALCCEKQDAYVSVWRMRDGNHERLRLEIANSLQRCAKQALSFFDGEMQRVSKKVIHEHVLN